MPEPAPTPPPQTPTVWTIKALVAWTTDFLAKKGVEGPRAEAQILLAHVLRCKKVDLLVRYDEQYATDLVTTLEAYLAHNCNMNATAQAIYAHRHTVSYRLDRIRELSGLDPTASEDRERLGLGLKAYRIIAPRLPR